MKKVFERLEYLTDFNGYFLAVPINEEGDLETKYDQFGYRQIQYDNCKESALHRRVMPNYGKMITFLKFSNQWAENFPEYLNQIEKILNLPATKDFTIVSSRKDAITLIKVNNPFWEENGLNIDTLHFFVKIYKGKIVYNWKQLENTIRSSKYYFGEEFQYFIKNFAEISEKEKNTKFDWWSYAYMGGLSYRMNGIVNLVRASSQMAWLREKVKKELALA